jgi:AraC-like DNA-binding protein
VKISNWTGLQWVNHYHQEPNRHPVNMVIPDFKERVEIVTGGRGWILHQNDWREIFPGDLIWNSPGDHTIGRSDFENPYRCLAVTLFAKKKRGSGMPRFSRWPDLEAVGVFTREMSGLFLDEDFDREILFEAIVSQLLLRVRMHARKEGREELPAPLRMVLQRLEASSARPCRVEELAAVAGWSVAHLHEVFKRYLNASPHQMVMRLRLRAVRERLASTTQPVKQIAVECGFADSAALANFFKSATGLTPGAFRDQSRHGLG